MDWNKFVKVFNIDIGGIEIKKEVSRCDVIMALLNEGEIAFKSKKGHLLSKLDNQEIRKIAFQMIREDTDEKIAKARTLLSQPSAEGNLIPLKKESSKDSPNGNNP